MKFGKNNAVIMEDGTVYHAYAGCISLHPEGHICGGFQLAMHDNNANTFDGRSLPDELKMSVDHRIEVAEHLIRQWSEYREQQVRLRDNPKKKPKATRGKP